MESKIFKYIVICLQTSQRNVLNIHTGDIDDEN